MTTEAPKSAKGQPVDYTALEADVAACKALAAKDLHGALESLLVLEKQQRQAEDVTGTRTCCLAILDCCYKAGQWKLLNEHIVLLSKRRGQLRQAIQAFVREAMTYLDSAPDQPTMVELIETIRTVTDGKIFVEIERARVTRRLATIHEAAGKLDQAAEVLQELAVETFGAMHKSEKIFFILEQVRLCLDRRDFVRAQILAKKISPRAFLAKEAEDPTQPQIGIEGTVIEPPEASIPPLLDLKLRYYALMVRYHEHQGDYLEAGRCHRAVYDTESVAADPQKWGPVLRAIAWFLALSPIGVETTTLLHTTLADKHLQDLPLYRDLLQAFAGKEIIGWAAFSAKFGPEIEAATDMFGGEHGAKRRADLRLRVTQHNILAVATFYSRLTLARLSELLALPAADAEKHLADMVVAKVISAKIDRPSGLIRFSPRRTPEAVLNSWSSNISKLLGIVEKACASIQKEGMRHKIQIGSQ